MKPRRLQNGEHVISCTHVNIHGPNNRVTVIDLKSTNFDFIRKGVDDTNKARWMLLCHPCVIAADPMAGVPYKLFQLGRDVGLGA